MLVNFSMFTALAVFVFVLAVSAAHSLNHPPLLHRLQQLRKLNHEDKLNEMSSCPNVIYNRVAKPIHLEENFKELVGSFPVMTQLGYDHGTNHAWEFSLCDNSFAGFDQVCYNHIDKYWAGTRESANPDETCSFGFSSFRGIYVDDDPDLSVTRLKFRYIGFGHDSLKYEAWIYVTCDPFATRGLESADDDRYTVEHLPDPDGYFDFVYTFKFFSAGVCPSSSSHNSSSTVAPVITNTTTVPISTTVPVSTQAPSPNDNKCPGRITFADGSVISTENAENFVAGLPNLEQVGFYGGNHSISVSLCNKNLRPSSSGAPECFNPHYIVDEACDWPFTVLYTVYGLDGATTAENKLKFIYTNEDYPQWTFHLTCSCDPTVETMRVPSKQYDVIKNGNGGFDFTASITSRHCCAVPPTPPPSNNSLCRLPIKFPNGTSVNLENANLFGYFPDAMQKGLLPGLTHPFYMSLCSPGFVPQNTPIVPPSCVRNTDIFLAEGETCSSLVFTVMNSFPSTTLFDSINFEYIGIAQDQRYKAEVNCYCDRNAEKNANLKLVGNSYIVSATEDYYLYQFTVSSRSCCAN